MEHWVKVNKTQGYSHNCKSMIGEKLIMFEKVLIYLNKQSKQEKLDAPYIIKIDNLYDEFLADVKHYNKLSKIYKCFNNQMIRYELISELIEESKKGTLSIAKVNRLEIFFSDLIAGYNVFLIELKKIAGDEIFDKITHFIYDENRNYRILAELRNIIQHKNNIHFYYFQNHLVIDFVELLKGYKITDEKFNKTFKGLSKIQVLGLWDMFKQTQEYLVMYLYIALSDINKLSRLCKCLEKFDREDNNLAIRTTNGNYIEYEYIMLDVLKILIKLNKTAPPISKDKIMKLLLIF